MEKLKVLDLFSGIGGFSLGLERTEGFETAAFCEIDEHCRKVLRKHWPEVELFKDVSELKFDNTFGVLKNSDYPVPKAVKRKIDVICGGSPCQDISFAGARKGIIDGKRSSLWKEYFRLITEIRPKYVIFENVEYIRKNGLGVVLNDLSSIGYLSEWSVFTAEAFGLPHKRERLYLVSYPSSERFYEHFGEERYLQTNEEWPDKKTYSEGEKCQFESIEVRKILSPGSVEDFMSSRTNRKSAISEVRRVTYGIPYGMDENRRKQRIKQLGNSIIPDIAEYIGERILSHEASKCL